MDTPETRYAWNGDIGLAYQVIGAGPDLLYLQGFVSNVMLNWEGPSLSRFLRRLSGSTRLIATDRRGYGCSERFTPDQIPPLETLMDDLLVVLDAAGSERTSIFASWDCGFLGCLFAATFPERTTSLILYGASPTWAWSEETPWELTEEQLERELSRTGETWGDRAIVEELARWGAPSVVDDPVEIEWWMRYKQLSAAPGAWIAETRRYSRTDVRPVLPTIHTPTLVLGRRESPDPPIEAARFLAGRIPGAELVELAGEDSPPWLGDQQEVISAVEAFLGTERQEDTELDRVLATILFTDIVDSTARSAAMGDRRWREVADEHDRIVRSRVERYSGREVKSLGDGFLAIFDGPARAIRCATAAREGVRQLGIEIRAGLHTGEVEMMGDDVGGIAVHIAARVAALAGVSEVMTSSTVRDLVAGSGLTFEDAGEHELKGVPDRWHLYRVIGP